MAAIPPALFTFLSDLAENNDREWFAGNRDRYEVDVVAPSLSLIEAMGPRLASISPRFLAIAKKQGGSMFRIHRDTRFSKDKTPYKTHVGIQFRHEAASGDVHAPGFYLHLAPGDVGVGVGMWHPDPGSLRRFRERLVADPDAWAAVLGHLDDAGLSFMGDSLVRPPRGIDPDHPFVEDLKRKDLAVYRALPEAAVARRDFPDALADEFRRAAPLVAFLCETLDLAF